MNEWLVIFGVFSALGSFVYRLNGHRGLVLNGRTDVDSMHRVPTAVAAGTGFLSSVSPGGSGDQSRLQARKSRSSRDAKA